MPTLPPGANPDALQTTILRVMLESYRPTIVSIDDLGEEAEQAPLRWALWRVSEEVGGTYEHFDSARPYDGWCAGVYHRLTLRGSQIEPALAWLCAQEGLYPEYLDCRYEYTYGGGDSDLDSSTPAGILLGLRQGGELVGPDPDPVLDELVQYATR